MPRKYGDPVNVVAGGFLFPLQQAVTKSDVTTYTPELAALFVGTGGTVAVVNTQGGATVSYGNVPNGTYLWGPFYQVLSTGTSASNLVGLN